MNNTTFTVVVTTPHNKQQFYMPDTYEGIAEIREYENRVLKLIHEDGSIYCYNSDKWEYYQASRTTDTEETES